MLKKSEIEPGTKIVRLTNEIFKKKIEEGVVRILEAIANSNGSPSVYVGTYGKYNNGSIKGEWLDLTDFRDYDEFMDKCREIHGDESDPEFMFQDMEYVPSCFGGEWGIKEEIFDYINDNPEYGFDIKFAVAEQCSDSDEYFRVIDDIYIFDGCNTMSEVAERYIDDCGGVAEAVQSPQYYFDYEQYGRDVAMDGPFNEENESVYEEFGVDEDDDYALGEAVINEFGGLGELDKDKLEIYFDYEKFGRAMELDGKFIEYDGGYIEIPN